MDPRLREEGHDDAEILVAGLFTVRAAGSSLGGSLEERGDAG
jgi:hypothetical protein